MDKTMINKQPDVVYDVKSDVLYLAIKKGVEEEFIEIAPGINVEMDKMSNVIGIEILKASKVLQPVSKLLIKQF